MKKILVGIILTIAIWSVGCSTFKDNFDKSYDDIVAENVEEMYDTEKEAKEFATLIETIGEDLSAFNTIEEAKPYIEKTTKDISKKIDKLSKETHPDAQLMIEGYTLMSETLYSVEENPQNTNLLLENLKEKALEISEKCRY